MNRNIEPVNGYAPRLPPHVVVTASSTGGLAALSTILARLPHTFPAPIIVVQHRGVRQPYFLSGVLARRTQLHVKYAEEGDRLLAGTVYIALPHAHLVVRPDGRLSYSNHRKIRFLRSAANPLFESASEVFGKRVIAVVLTGRDADATDGVQSVKKHGGIVIAQDRATSEIFDMPRSAIGTGCVDHVLPLETIASALERLVEAGHPVGHAFPPVSTRTASNSVPD
jgi:two-component system chemotaxis response regulator CheB